jgi:hypothetical protein
VNIASERDRDEMFETNDPGFLSEKFSLFMNRLGLGNLTSEKQD